MDNKEDVPLRKSNTPVETHNTISRSLADDMHLYSQMHVDKENTQVKAIERVKERGNLNDGVSVLSDPSIATDYPVFS